MNRRMIEEFQARQGLTNEKLGDMIGVTAQAFHWYKVGKRPIAARDLKAVADFFGVSMDELMKEGSA